MASPREQENPHKDLRINATPYAVARKLMQGGAPKREPSKEPSRADDPGGSNGSGAPPSPPSA